MAKVFTGALLVIKSKIKARAAMVAVSRDQVNIKTCSVYVMSHTDTKSQS